MQQIISPQSIMLEFAEATGLSEPSKQPRRYLWTDAFAVGNYLDLYRQSRQQSFLQLALKLVDQVHQTLGKQRKDSGRSGWLSGLSEEQGRLHPTQGGLRIGKKLAERQLGEPADESLEWDQDGQYYHYLTKWMQALNALSRVTGDGIFNQWALELAKVAHAAFVYTPSTSISFSPSTSMSKTRSMYWKMSIDLSHPLVDSMGHHDPLDGLITYQQLQTTAEGFPETTSQLNLKAEIKELEAICSKKEWATGDALGIGGLLTDAFILVQLIGTQQLEETDRLVSLLDDIELSQQAFATHNQLNLPAEYRLAFRELGLAIGLHSINKMQLIIEQHSDNFNNSAQLTSILNKLSQFQQIAELIDNFWIKPEHQSVSSWLQHADINNVMLATSLLSAKKWF